MPAVRESSDEAPEKLEIVEVRPGVRLKLNAADRAALEGFASSSADDAARHTEAKRLAAIEGLEVPAPLEVSDEPPAKPTRKK